MPRIIAVLGPTAVGKTDLAFELASRIGAEIVSADSMAVYRGADIGTAKPTPGQRALVPCHLLDVVEPNATFNASEYRDLARAALTGIADRGRAAVVVGGTGLYVRALLDGLSLAGVPADPSVRAELMARAREDGSVALHHELSAVDPASAARLHPNDTVRIVRALEVRRLTGRSLTEWIAEDRASRRAIPALRIGCRMGQAELDARIEARVDRMMEEGLIGEVVALREAGAIRDRGIMCGLGYAQLCAHLDGDMPLADAVGMIKRDTRRYARRQMSWFRSDRGIRWVDASGARPHDVAETIQRIADGHERQ
jgi:tRNA dimethylallyltransferase